MAHIKRTRPALECRAADDFGYLEGLKIIGDSPQFQQKFVEARSALMASISADGPILEPGPQLIGRILAARGHDFAALGRIIAIRLCGRGP